MKPLQALAMGGVLLAATFAGNASGADGAPFVFRSPERPIGVFMSHPAFFSSGFGPAFQPLHLVPPVAGAPVPCNVHRRADAAAMQPGPRHYS